MFIDRSNSFQNKNVPLTLATLTWCWKQRSFFVTEADTTAPHHVMSPHHSTRYSRPHWLFIWARSQFHFEGSHMQLGVMNVLLNYIHLCKFPVPVEFFCGNIVTLTNGVSFAMWLNPFSVEQLAVISATMSPVTAGKDSADMLERCGPAFRRVKSQTSRHDVDNWLTAAQIWWTVPLVALMSCSCPCKVGHATICFDRIVPDPHIVHTLGLLAQPFTSANPSYHQLVTN